MRTLMAAVLLIWAGSAWAADFTAPTSSRSYTLDGTSTRFLQESADSGPKSSKVAFLMSLVVPGLGEFYTGATKRAIAFVAVEALTWINYTRWRSKGNDLKAKFRAFADQHWNESRYRDWQVYNAAHGRPYNETETLPCKHTDPNAANCPKVDTQQYYEMIGKYDQFVYGWSDIRDVSFSIINDQVTSSIRLDYENQRNESNKFLKRASVILGLAVVNRIASAIHVSVHARSLNPEKASKRIWIEVTPLDSDGRPAAVAALNIRF
jgi:hypothetical protein